ncbi:MAG TPA: hypothetical protein VMV10_24595 [Pirellulales bacterium]|nr:hypothetical protein [Pirellulales bacterium]
MSQARRLLWLMLAAGGMAAASPQTATAQMFPYRGSGRRAVTVMGGPLGPAPLNPYAVSAYWGFLPDPIVARQSYGHQIIWTGPNGYVYRPLYADDDPSGIAQADGFKVVPQAPPADAAANPAAALPAAPPAVLQLPPADAGDPFDQALLLFRGGRYRESLAALERVPDAQAGEAELLAVQAFFAVADYPAAVDTLGRATESLPEDEWGRYVANYRDYFPSALRYIVHLRSLERVTNQFPDRADAKLLLAYHYGSLGFADQAIALLDQLKPDPLVERLRSHFARQRAAPAPELDDDAAGPAPVDPAPLVPRPARTGRPGPREF